MILFVLRLIELNNQIDAIETQFANFITKDEMEELNSK